MQTSQVIMLLFFLALKAIAAQTGQKSFLSSQQHLIPYEDFGGLFADASESTPVQSIDAYQSMVPDGLSATRQQQQQQQQQQFQQFQQQQQNQFTEQLTARRPVVIRTMIRMDNSLKLRSSPVNSITRVVVAQNDTFKLIKAQQEATTQGNVKTDREGYSSDYGALDLPRGFGNVFDNVNVRSEPVKSYDNVAPAPQPQSTFVAFPATPSAPIVLSDQLPPIQRVIEQVPVPMEVFHTIERQVPVPVPIVREVTREVPFERIVHVDRAVPVPIFIERGVPFSESGPIVRNRSSLPPSPVRSTLRLQSGSYPFAVLKERILTPFSGMSYGRFGRFLRSVTTCCRSSPRSYKR